MGDGLVVAQVTLRHRLLPLGTPSRCSLWCPRALDRSAIGLHRAHVTAADEAVRSVIEIVAVELVDAHPDGARGNKGIEDLVVEEGVHAGCNLGRIISPDHTLTA